MRELRRMREERGWTQQRLADESGVDRATISQIESGRRSPSIETLEKLADAMGREMGDFFPKAQASLFEESPEQRRTPADEFIAFVAQLEQGAKDRAEERARRLEELRKARDAADREIRRLESELGGATP